MYRKTIICLANSYKHGGFCIAGKEKAGSQIRGWIRPVSARPGHEVLAAEMRYEDHTSLKVLDIAEVALSGLSPLPHQPENHVLAAGVLWNRMDRASWTTIYQAQDLHDEAFWSGGGDSGHGILDRISLQKAEEIGSSLKLIHARDLLWHVQLEPGFEDRPAARKVRIEFNYMDRIYLLSVTDPVAKEAILARNDGVHTCREAMVCISLSEALSGYVYRLAATVITPARCS